MRINVQILLFLTLAVGFSLVSCASKTAESTEKSIINEELKEEEPKIESFVDWQFKGFGKDVPESAERIFALISPDAEIVDGIIVEENALTVFGKGSNPDQSVHVLEDAFEKHLIKYEETHELKELSLIEDYWIKINQDVWETDKPYIAIKVFELN